MKHLLVISLLLAVAPCISAQTIYEGTHIIEGDEDNYSITSPDELGWGGDYFIGGTHWPPVTAPPGPYYSQIKRVDNIGTSIWDLDLMIIDPSGNIKPNRTLHVDDAQLWEDASAMAVGYTKGASLDGLIYSVKDVGAFGNVLEFRPASATDNSNDVFNHSTEVIHENYNGWAVVGNSSPSGSVDNKVLVTFISNTGVVEWTLHLESETIGMDFDYGSHILHVPGEGFFVSGSGNLFNPALGTYTQGARAAMISYSGSLTWSEIYTHSFEAYNTVSASAFYDESQGYIYQIANGKDDPFFHENGFSLNVFKATNGQRLPQYRRNFHLENYAMKGMSIHPSLQGNNIVVGGFLQVPTPPAGANGWPNGLHVGDHPPFLIEFERLDTSETGASTVVWNRVYPVPSNNYGTTPLDDFEVFGNAGQPLFYHPEMTTKSEDSLTYTLIGLREVVTDPNSFDLEFIHTDLSGDAHCEEIELEVHEIVSEPYSVIELSNENKEYVLQNAPHVWDSNSPLLIPCDICDPVFTLTATNDCDEVTLSLLYDGDISDICLNIVWPDGMTESIPAVDTIIHEFADGFTGGTVCVTAQCCDFIGVGPFYTQCIPITLPDDCDCGSCLPFVTVCQNDFYSVAEQLDDPSAEPLLDITIGTLLLFPPCEGGCADAPYSIHVTLGSIITSFFGSCLDHHSIEYVVDGVVVETQGCGLYAPIDLAVATAGDHVLEVVLTNCTNPACVEVRTREFSVGDCVPPETPRFKLVDSPSLESMCGSAFNCSRYLSPLTAPAECMDIKWIVDGVEIDGGFYSQGHCFGWGCHTVQMKMVCIDDESVFSLSEPQTFCCGLIEIGPMTLLETLPEWLPYYYPLSTSINDDCKLEIEVGSPLIEEGVFNTFNIFEGIGVPPEPEIVGINPEPKFHGLEFNISLSQNNEVVGNIWSSSSTTGIWTDGPIHGVWTNGNADGVWTNGNATSLLSLNLEDPGNTWPGLVIDGNTSLQVCIDITGPDWLVANSTEPLQHCQDVYPCATQSTSTCPSDIDGDGIVATLDLLLFLSDFGTTCQ